MVFVHNSSLQPRYEDGIYLKPGEKSFIGIKRRFIQNAPSPYTECQDLTLYSSDLYNYIIKLNKTYRQKDCFDLCTQKFIIRKCGCYFTGFNNPNSNEIKPCSNLTEYNCTLKALNYVDIVECASEYCPLECDSIQYDLTVSSLIYPSLDDYNSLNISSSISYEEWRTKKIVIQVYYSELDYTLIQETPAMTLASLIAYLGGTMGLIVSVSFFTVLEISELIILLLYALFRTHQI